MIRKMICGLFLFCLFIAIPLAAVGIRHVDIGPSFIGFMNQTSRDLQYWKLTIPDIPNIPNNLIQFSGKLGDVIDALISFVTFFINLGNFLVNVINAIIGMVNMVIQFTQYVFTLIKNLVAFSDTLKRIGTPA